MTKKRFLLVEDDLIERMKFKKIVSACGDDFEVLEAEHGKDALSLLEAEKQSPPDVILLDINMPKMTGFDFIKQMKADAELKYIPVVFFTTSVNNKDLHLGYELGCAGYIVKPLKYEDYKRVVTSLYDYWLINQFYTE